MTTGYKYLFPFIVFHFSIATGQQPKLVERQTLFTTIKIAREKSIASLQAATLKENKYWQYRTFRSNYKPQLILEGQLPNFQKDNMTVTQPDGSIQFQPVRNDNSQLTLGVTQNIGGIGTQLFLNSNLMRFQDFDRKETRYNGDPLIIGFIQPLFSFNQLRWDKKTEPLRYEESKRKFIEDMEVVGHTASVLFFNLLINQINRDIAAKNKLNNDTLYKIAELRFDLGKLSQDELLQLKLATLNARKALAQANLDAESAMLDLKSYLGYKGDNILELALPDDIPSFAISTEKAIAEARENNRQAIEFKRILLEAEREVAKARGDNGLNATLMGTFGLTNTSTKIQGIYEDPRNHQVFEIGFQIPIMDWGRSESRIKTAMANKKLVEYTLKQQEINFEQLISAQVRQFNIIREQMKDNREADVTAEHRYKIAINRYILGDLSITDLNIALQEKDQAKRDYILSLKTFWETYFNIRTLTLFDFEKVEKIVSYN